MKFGYSSSYQYSHARYDTVYQAQHRIIRTTVELPNARKMRDGKRGVEVHGERHHKIEVAD